MYNVNLIIALLSVLLLINNIPIQPLLAQARSLQEEPVDIALPDAISSGIVASYFLHPPTFIENSSIELCKTIQDYLNLTEEEFSALYTPMQLWKAGAYDRLFFTSDAKGKIIGDIAIGDSLEKIEKNFGKSQFSTKEKYASDKTDYQRFLLYGYKTKDYYFAFQISPDTQKVMSICIRRRYPLPENQKDILVRLSMDYPMWYGGGKDYTSAWPVYSDKEITTYAQWARGTMSLISNYGFTSTSGIEDDIYGVYRDFEGSIPKLPLQKEFYSEKEYEPVVIFTTDYPEKRIYNVYSYMAQREDAKEMKEEVLSPSGKISAISRDWNPLDMRRTSTLYENSHVVLHWLDGSQPDRQIYFGHFPSFVAFINEGFLLENDMLGLHVYDIKKDKIVYSDSDLDDESRNGISIDYENSCILDENKIIRYRYSFDKMGNIQDFFKIN